MERVWDLDGLNFDLDLKRETTDDLGLLDSISDASSRPHVIVLREQEGMRG